MRAAVLESAPGDVEIEQITVSSPQSDEVLIRTLAGGLCHSDLHVMEGSLPSDLPSIMGHESAGIVEAVGEDVPDLAVGDMVVTCLTQFCGHCRQCRAGQSYLCVNRNSLGYRVDGTNRLSRADGSLMHTFAGLGGFAEEMLVHHNAVVKVPADLPPDKGALLGCGVVTGVGSAIRGARVEPGSTVVVIGCGGIGLNIVQGARLAGAARIIAVDLHKEKLELARIFGATDTLVGSSDTVGEVVELTNGGVDYAFEAIGLPATALQAFQMLAPGRTAYLVGLTPASAQVSIPGVPMTIQAKGIQGLFMGMSRFKEDIPMLADLYLQGRLKLDELVSSTITLDQVNEGYEVMRAGTEARSVIIFD